MVNECGMNDNSKLLNCGGSCNFGAIEGFHGERSSTIQDLKKCVALTR